MGRAAERTGGEEGGAVIAGGDTVVGVGYGACLSMGQIGVFERSDSAG
jgi:hypothetical protein